MRKLPILLAALILPILVSHPASATTKQCTISNAVLTGSHLTFTEPQGCVQDVALVSYSAPGPKFDPKTASQQKLVDAKLVTNLGNGTYSWTVKQAPCYFQVDFVYGTSISDLSASNLYGDRIIASSNGGQACTTTTTAPKPPAPKVTTSVSPVGSTTTTTSIPVAVNEKFGDDTIGRPVTTTTTAPQIASGVTVTKPAASTALAFTGSNTSLYVTIAYILFLAGAMVLYGAHLVRQLTSRTNVDDEL